MSAVLTLPGPVVSVDWVRAHIDAPELRIADVRWSLSGPPGAERYADGHLPGAVFLDSETELSSPGEGPGRHPVPTADKPLPPAALRERYDGLGVADRPVVAYCGSSLSATHDLLAMELAGVPNGRLYEGSWSHWSSDPDRPAATGSEP